jgi:hypothetical protein
MPNRTMIMMMTGLEKSLNTTEVADSWELLRTRWHLRIDDQPKRIQDHMGLHSEYNYYS